MRLDAKDIEAIARSRVSRAEGSRQTYWLLSVMVAIGISLFVVRFNPILGWVCGGGGVLGFIYYMNGLSKRQNAYKEELLKEWRVEQAQVTYKDIEKEKQEIQ